MSNPVNPSQTTINVFLVASGTNVSYNYLDLKTNIEAKLLNTDDLVTIQLVDFQCYNTFLTISAQQGNNTVQTVSTYGDNGLYATNTITIPDGSYTMDSLLEYLNGQGDSNVAGGWTFPTSLSNSSTDTGQIFKTAQNEDGDSFQGIYTGAGYDPTASATVNVNGTYSKQVLTANLNSGSPLVSTAVNPFSVNSSNVVSIAPPPANVFYKTYVNGNSKATDPFVMKQFGLVDNPKTTKFNQMMGFNTANIGTVSVGSSGMKAFMTNVNESTDDTSTVQYNANLTGTQAYNLGGTSCLYFCIVNLLNQNYSSDPTINSKNCLACIPLTAAFGDLQTYSPPKPIVTSIANQNLETMTVVILDQYGREVDFGGQQWRATIQLNFQTNQKYISGNLNRGEQDFQPRDLNQTNDATYQLMNQHNPMTGYKRQRSGLLHSGPPPPIYGAHPPMRGG